LTLCAMQQIAPLFGAQCPVLLTDISVLNTLRSSPDSDISALDVLRRPVSGLLRIRHLTLFADRGLLRTLHFAPCVELVSIYPQHLSPGTKLGLLRALCLAPALKTDCSVFNPLAAAPNPYLYALDALRSPRARIASRSTLDALC